MRKLLLIAPLILVGCAKVSDYQNKCEQIYPRLTDMANCLDRSIKNDSRMSSASQPKLYVLAAKYLGQGVDNGNISDAQARMELQNLYVNMQRQESMDEQSRSAAIQQGLLNAQAISTMQSIQQQANRPTYVPPVRLQNNNLTTTCDSYGNQTTCHSY
ncbi:lipoprotein [Tatumella terrea]